MSQEVCGICWCPYDNNGACGCKPQTGATMKRNDILRMAREAGLWEADISKPLFDFAALVTAAKDAEHQQALALQQRSYEREIQLEVEAEREACAKVCEGRTGGAVRADQWWRNGFKEAMRQCAAAIRARNNT